MQFRRHNVYMSWHGIEGHDAIVERFRDALGTGRLASSFLFVGPPGVGKRSFALKLAEALLCRRRAAADLDPCGACQACRQVLAATHPDLIQIARPKDKSEIPVALFIGSKEKRMREGLCHDISLKPFYGGRKIVIIDDADHLNEEGANCLLKTLEEPPPASVLILIGTSPEKQLPTIRSRCQVVRFDPLPEEVVADLLLATQQVSDRERALELARQSGGGLRAALELSDDDLWQFRRTLLSRLAETPLASIDLAVATAKFVDSAGKEATKKRLRATQIVEFALAFYRGLLRALCGAGADQAGHDSELARAVAVATDDWLGREEDLAACVERCLDAITHIERNANLANVIDCWLDDLARSSALVVAK